MKVFLHCTIDWHPILCAFATYTQYSPDGLGIKNMSVNNKYCYKKEGAKLFFALLHNERVKTL